MFHYTRFATSKLTGQKLILWASLAGVGLTLLSRIIVIFLNTHYPALGPYWKANFFPGDFSGTASLALILGLVLWYPLNLLSNKDKVAGWSTRKFGTRLEILLRRSLYEEKQIIVTLSGSKVYVGFILWQPEESFSEHSYFGILPTISGYRDSETKRVKFITEYTNIYEKLWSNDEETNESLDQEDFVKYFKASSVETASIYDPDVYLLFGSNTDEGDGVEIENKTES